MFDQFKNYLSNLYASAAVMNRQNISDLLEVNSSAKYLDIGSDDGSLTDVWAQKISTKSIFGLDIIEERASMAKAKGISVIMADLNQEIKVQSESFDVITANQVIEHLHNSDIFLAETYRVLKPGGYLILSTENASSWCNIIASVFGWQIFSLTNFSNKLLGIGNPLALYRGKKSYATAWNHVRIYNYLGLIEYCQLFDFSVEAICGAGYFPLPSFLGKIDRRHSHFITLKLRKK